MSVSLDVYPKLYNVVFYFKPIAAISMKSQLCITKVYCSLWDMLLNRPLASPAFRYEHVMDILFGRIKQPCCSI